MTDIVTNSLDGAIDRIGQACIGAASRFMGIANRAHSEEGGDGSE